MEKILLAGVCALALSTSSAIAQTYEQGGPNYYGPPSSSMPHRLQSGTVGSAIGNRGIYNNTRPLAPNEMLPNGMTPDVTVSPAPSDRATVPGNLDAGGDGSQSNPNTIQPGASKAGGGE